MISEERIAELIADCTDPNSGDCELWALSYAVEREATAELRAENDALRALLRGMRAAHSFGAMPDELLVRIDAALGGSHE